MATADNNLTKKSDTDDSVSTRYSVIISPSTENEFSESTWSDVAKKTITEKLSQIQVKKTKLNQKW